MKSLLLSALVASALVLVAETQPCDKYFTNPNMTCIEAYECGDRGSSITIYEDCSPGSELLTAIDDTNPSCNCDHLTVSGRNVRLKTQLDAEKDNTFTINCYLFSSSYITEFPVKNVNEFLPQVQDQGPIFDIRVPEGGGSKVITTFSYKDEDYGETESLTCELRSGDIDNLFEVESKYENEMMTFYLNTTDSLDFEKMMYYRLEYDIKSTDSRGDILAAEQTILVFVDDIGDNPPYWIKTQPSVSLEECDADVSVVQVEASDRDVEVNNAIRYSITDGNDAGFFSIDDVSGEVKTAKEIDREALATTTFALTITATEHNADGSVAAEPNSSTQATNVYIVDVNDNVPAFNAPEYYAEIDELNENEDVFLNIDVIVADMDEGQHGTFTLTSDKPNDLVVSPSQGMGNETLSLKAKWRGGDTLFDYEKTQENLRFTLTATEVSDPSHVGTATLVVKINDVNDNSPVFSESVYNVDVKETEPVGFLVTTVTAVDSDISPEFGTDSIRYSSTCEDKLLVSETTGEVTLAANVLDYESQKTLQCTIEAHDLGGAAAGKSGSTKVKIAVSDVIDEQPSIIQPDVTTIQENTPEDTPVGQPVRATDADEGANIIISIDWEETKAYLQNNVVNPSIVKDWFKILETDVNPDDYSAVVYVGPNNPDREEADRVELSIVAEDINTESGTNRASTIFTINIDNTNDETPFFVDDYSTQQVKEEVSEGTLIAKLLVNDYDLDDIINMTISNDSLVRVVMEDNDFKTWNLEVSPGARIDRETQEEINVTVTITDSNGASDEMEITISIIDINDNTPVISKCTTEVEVAEDEDTGHHVGNVTATDEDIGAHAEVKYYLFNDQLGMPFEVNEETGEVTVLLGALQKLDREVKASWELSVYARDGCEEGELDCQRKNSDPCNIVVKVTDVNDEAPNGFQCDPPADIFVVDEDMLEGELVGGEKAFKIWAQDGDQPGTVNTMITYYVECVNEAGLTDDLGLFTAVNVNDTWSQTSYCQLMATQNLTWQRGLYEIHLLAEDSGEPKLNGSKIFTIEIQDSNDHTPEFKFDGCLKDKLQIKMEENYYQPGEKVLCATNQNAQPLEISVTDDDIGENKEFTCDIDYEKSTAVPVNGVDQLQEFELKRESYGCVLYVNSIIDRESGRRYNLSLHVKDKGTPPRESWEYLEVIVTNAFEAPPYFCLEGTCTDTVYMKENDPGVTSMFLEATDPDNVDSDPDDDGTYENVYYQIVGGSTSFFELGGSNRMNNSIKLRNLPQGLDREDVPEYQLYIDVTNDPYLQPPISEPVPRNYTLYLTVIVQDENDNPPEFKKAITIASFTQNDEKGKKIAVIEANDVDLNETITYSLGKFAWNETDGTVSTDEPFKIENGADLILNFKPTGLNRGYCTFRIYAHDKDNKTNFTTAKVYVITNAFQLPVSFNNAIRDVSNKTEDIEDVFTSVYQYSCVVDSTTAVTSDSGEAVEGQTMVYMHFIDEINNEPVRKDVIIQQTTNVDTIRELRSKLNEIGLNLNSVGDKEVVSEGNDLLLLQVLLGVVSLVLGSLVVLLLTAYCIRTRSLERQVKVLSTNTFGSKESDLNRAGMEMEVVPGSNMFKGEGANPMYNMSEDELRNDDTSSIGSGDSVLVGVEDNPEFKNYINRRADAPAPSEGALGARSIDQVSAPAAFAETTRSNPLLDMGEVEDRDLSEALRDFEVTIRRSSCESEGSFGHDNPNFTFGK